MNDLQEIAYTLGLVLILAVAILVGFVVVAEGAKLAGKGLLRLGRWIRDKDYLPLPLITGFCYGLAVPALKMVIPSIAVAGLGIAAILSACIFSAVAEDRRRQRVRVAASPVRTDESTDPPQKIDSEIHRLEHLLRTGEPWPPSRNWVDRLVEFEDRYIGTRFYEKHRDGFINGHYGGVDAPDDW